MPAGTLTAEFAGRRNAINQGGNKLDQAGRGDQDAQEVNDEQHPGYMAGPGDRGGGAVLAVPRAMVLGTNQFERTRRSRSRVPRAPPRATTATALASCPGESEVLGAMT